MMYEIRCIISGCVVIACWFIITDVYLSRQSRPSQKTIYHPDSLNGLKEVHITSSGRRNHRKTKVKQSDLSEQWMMNDA